MRVTLKYMSMFLFFVLLSMGNISSFSMEEPEEEFVLIEPGKPVDQIIIENNSFFPLSLSFVKKGATEETKEYLSIDLGTELHGPRIVLNKEEIIGPVTVSIAKPESFTNVNEWTKSINNFFPKLTGRLTNWMGILQRIPFNTLINIINQTFTIDLKEHGPILHIFWPLPFALKGTQPLFLDLVPNTFATRLWYYSRASLVPFMQATVKATEKSSNVLHDWFKEKRKPKLGQTVEQIFTEEIEPQIRILEEGWPPKKIIEEYLPEQAAEQSE